MAKASWSTSPASRTIRLRSPPIARRVNAGLAPPLVHDVVNELSPSKRNRAIVGGYQSLREDLARLSPDRSVPFDPDQGECLPAPGGETEGRWLQRAQLRPRHLLSQAMGATSLLDGCNGTRRAL